MRVIHLLLTFAIVAAATAGAADLEGRVVAVQDGDTLTVLDGEHRTHLVRLAGIDAPEKAQPLGQRSKQALSDCAYGQQVSVEGRKLDRYGRLVGKVESAGIDCNLRQVALGLAWHYKTYEREQSTADRAIYSDEEMRARAARLGLWIDSWPLAPWDFRRGKRTMDQAEKAR